MCMIHQCMNEKYGISICVDVSEKQSVAHCANKSGSRKSAEK